MYVLCKKRPILSVTTKMKQKFKKYLYDIKHTIKL